jgi:hypothetical protein
LVEDQEFERSVLRELRQLGEGDINIAPFVREYVQSLGIVHEWLRAETKDHFTEWKASLNAALERAITQYGTDAAWAFLPLMTLPRCLKQFTSTSRCMSV